MKLRHEIEGSAYLAGGTEVMRLGSSLAGCEAVIDINGLLLSGIREEDGRIVIGALTTLEEIRNLASEAVLSIMCSKGLKEKSAAEYFGKKECRALVLSFSIDKDRTGRYERIARSSHSHAAVTAAKSNGVYAYAVSGSGIAFGGEDSWKDIQYADDLTGSADYKRYLASVIFRG